MEDRKAVIKDATYLRDLSVFEKDLFPYIGKMPIDQIRVKTFLLVPNGLKSVVLKRWLDAQFH